MHVFNFSISCLRGFCLRGRGMELYAKHATSRHIKWSEPIKSYKEDGMLFAFPQGPRQHYYYYAATPRRHIKGRLSNFSTVWMIFYLLNVVLLLHEIYLFQSFPLAFIWGLSMPKYSYWGWESHDHLTYASWSEMVCDFIVDPSNSYFIYKNKNSTSITDTSIYWNPGIYC